MTLQQHLLNAYPFLDMTNVDKFSEVLKRMTQDERIGLNQKLVSAKSDDERKQIVNDLIGKSQISSQKIIDIDTKPIPEVSNSPQIMEDNKDVNTNKRNMIILSGVIILFVGIYFYVKKSK